jgi:hypothetical protein
MDAEPEPTRAERPPGRAITVLFIGTLGLLCASCSSGPSAAEQQAQATALVHKVAVDSAAVGGAVRGYKADVADPTMSKSQLRSAGAAITAAVAREAKDTRACLSLESALPGRISRNVGWDKSICQLVPTARQHVEVTPMGTGPLIAPPSRRSGTLDCGVMPSAPSAENSDPGVSVLWPQFEPDSRSILSEQPALYSEDIPPFR